MRLALNRVVQQDRYFPVLTELHGVACIGFGIAQLGFSQIIKANNYYTGKKDIMPFITDDSARFFSDLGKGALKIGIVKILPATTAAVTLWAVWQKCMKK